MRTVSSPTETPRRVVAVSVDRQKAVLLYTCLRGIQTKRPLRGVMECVCVDLERERQGSSTLTEGISISIHGTQK